MALNRSSNFLIAAIVSFIVGALLYLSRNNKPVNEDFNKTLAKEKDGRFFLLFNGAVVLSREVTKEQYDTFLMQYPLGVAPNNVLNAFSSPPNKYTYENGKYYEYTWNGILYNNRVEITKDEYDYFKRNNITSLLVDDTVLI